MAATMRPYVQTYPVRSTLKTESEGLLQKEDVLKKTTNKNKNLVKRGKTWTCIYYEYDPARGKKVPRWKGGFKTKSEARAAQAKLQAEANNRGFFATDMTFKEYREMYLRINAEFFKPGTVRYYNRVFKYTMAIDDKAMKNIKAEDIERVHETMKSSGKLSAATTRKYLVQLKAIFTFAEKREDISSHPFNRFVMPPDKPVKHHAPTMAQVKGMIEKSVGTLIHLPILLAVMLGLRRSEVFGLQYSDFDFEEGTVKIERQVVNCAVKGTNYQPAEPKTESGFRMLKVPESLLAIIKKRHEENPDHSWVIAKPDGSRYTPVYIMKLYTDFRDANGYDGVRFHDLRHAYGTICLNNKVPIKAISDTMGHHNIKVTCDIYCETRELRDAPAEVMDEEFGSLLQ